MPDPTEIAATFLANGRGEQDRSPRFNPRLDERLANRDERSQTARVVRDAGTLEPRPAPRHRHIQFGTEHGIEMCAENHAPRSPLPAPPTTPATHVADSVDRDLVQSGITEHLRHPRAARSFRPGWGGNRGQRSLAAERRFVGALDVRARGAHAFA